MTERQISDLVPMLVCNDVKQSYDFYTNMLGFEGVDFDPSIGLTGFATIEFGSIRLMLTSPSYYQAPSAQDGKPLTDTIYYYYTDDVIGLKRQFDDRGIETSDLKVRFYGLKELEIQDPDGRLLIFGEDTDEPPTPE